MPRRRADVALTEAGFFPSREQARAAILARRVAIAGATIDKPGTPVDDDAVFEIAPAPEFVSRGGHKLAGALSAFGVEVAGLKVLDVGASTGGFSDCVLKAGASAVTALDVGYGQLAWSLRTDPRVTVLERTNIRTVEGPIPGSPFDLAVIDVSFVGLAKVLPHVAGAIGENGQVLALVKPQFEVGKGSVGKKGVVREPELHARALRTVVEAAVAQSWTVRNLTWSPIKGPEGNIEFWVHLARSGRACALDVDSVVASAHAALGGQ